MCVHCETGYYSFTKPPVYVITYTLLLYILYVRLNQNLRYIPGYRSARCSFFDYAY